MKFDELHDEWQKDRFKEGDDIAVYSGRLGYLHGKYYKFWRMEKLIYNQLIAEVDVLTGLKTTYYEGKLSQEELLKYGWEQWQRSLTRQQIEDYVQTDKELVQLKLKMANQKDKVQFLTDTIKFINDYGYKLKNAMDYLKFTHGG